MESVSLRLPIMAPPTAHAENFWSSPGRLSQESVQEERTDTAIQANRPWPALKKQVYLKYFAAAGAEQSAWRPMEEQFRRHMPACSYEAVNVIKYISDSA